MRLLPATRRGIWLSALAAWLAGCAGAWWLMPVRPRCVIPNPCNFNFIGDGSAIIATETEFYGGPISVWDLNTGQRTRRLLDGQWKLARYTFWHAARYASNGEASARPDRVIVCKGEDVRVLDLTSGDLKPLGLSLTAHEANRMFVFYSRDHRVAAIQIHADPPDKRNLATCIVCDLQSGRVVHMKLGVTGNLTPDGSRFVRLESESEGSPVDAVFYDTATGHEVHRFRAANSSRRLSNIVGFTSDRRFLALQLDSSGFSFHPMQVFDVSTGQPTLGVPQGYVRTEFVPAGNDMVETLLRGDGSQMIRRWDLSKGIVRWNADVGHVDDLRIPARLQADAGGISATTDFFGRPLSQFETWFRRISGASIGGGIRSHVRRLALETGKEICRFDLPGRAVVSPDGQSVITFDNDESLLVWDLPPRKPLTWFAGFAAAWGLLLAWLAQRRCVRCAGALCAAGS